MDAWRVAGSALPRLGALDRWRSEIRKGLRKSNAAHFDDLQAAACNELAALQAEQQGDRERACWFMDRALLRLHDCYLHDPHDKDKQDHRKPGPGARMLAKIKAEAAGAAAPTREVVSSARPANPWTGFKPIPARGWAAR